MSAVLVGTFEPGSDPVARRFVAKLVVDENGCWLWCGATSNAGYGRFKDADRLVMAHRYAYEFVVGPIPEGLQLDHLCRVRRCCNPEHLEPVTCRENLLRGETTTAARAAQTHCIHGHLLDASNTYVKPNGCRNCRTCRAESDRRHKASKR